MTRFRHRFFHCLPALVAAVVFGFSGLFSRIQASLIINEIFQSSQADREWVEFLVTSDITLGALDSFWFGNTDAATDSITTMTHFDSAAILNSVSYFTSTSDIVKAGTLIVVGGDKVTPDFNYSPNLLTPGDSDAWSFSLSGGVGISSTNPFDLNKNSGAVWLASSQPTNSIDVTNFISAVAYLNTDGDLSGGLIADYITTASLTQGTFQTIHGGTGGGFDGKLGNNWSISNAGTGTSISFNDTENNTETIGVLNGGLNTSTIGELRAVPEPSALIPAALIALGGFLFWGRRQTRPAEA